MPRNEPQKPAGRVAFRFWRSTACGSFEVFGAKAFQNETTVVIMDAECGCYIYIYIYIPLKLIVLGHEHQ